MISQWLDFLKIFPKAPTKMFEADMPWSSLERLQCE